MCRVLLSSLFLALVILGRPLYGSAEEPQKSSPSDATSTVDDVIPLTMDNIRGYGTLSHLGAHSILAVSDCSYMVLSLEGPRWVLYAVKEDLGKGDDLPAGAVVDLNAMHTPGEEIYDLPVSDEEMKSVVQSVYDTLPELKPDDQKKETAESGRTVSTVPSKP